EDWATRRGYTVTTPRVSAARSATHFIIKFPEQPKLLTFCRLISQTLSPRAECLLWILESGIWPSSENWHLYYRLRNSYAEHRLLHEAPGHLFLDFEDSDFVTYLQLAVAHGWDVEILPNLTYGAPATSRVFVSHDEFVVIRHDDSNVLQSSRATFESAGFQV